MPLFHSKDGWFFRRLEDGEDGDVHVIKTRDGREPRFASDDADEHDPDFLSNIEAQVIFDKSTWASIVATVSVRGETAKTWEEALRFHNGSDVRGG